MLIKNLICLSSCLLVNMVVLEYKMKKIMENRNKWYLNEELWRYRKRTRTRTLPRCGLVTVQIVRHILCSISFWCGFVCQGSCSFPVSSQFLIHISFISIFHFSILYSRTTIITRRHELKQIRFFINIMLPNFRNSRTVNSNMKSQI